MKLVLIIVLICVIMIIATALSNQYKDKYDFYNNLINFLNQFKINISFKQEKIIQFLNKVKAKKQFTLFIDAYKDYLNSGKLDLTKITLLDCEEILELEEIIKSLGKYDIKTELTQLDLFISKMKIKQEKANEDKNKLCPMIIKLSLLFAVGLAIILI